MIAGRYTYAFPDGRFQIRWKGVSLPYKVFDKNQRVTHAAVTEHKLLGDQLAMIKEMQEAMNAEGPQKARMKTNSEKSGYQKTGKSRRGRPPLARKASDPQAAAPP